MLSISIKISAEKVIVTMFVNEFSNAYSAVNMIAAAYIVSLQRYLPSTWISKSKS